MMVSIILMIVIGLVMLVIGILVGYILRKSIGEKTIGNAEQKAKNMILDAENRAETVKKELVLEAKEEAHRQRNDLEKEIRERRNEIQKSERRLIQKEESIDRKLENIEKKEESIINKEKRSMYEKVSGNLCIDDGDVAAHFHDLRCVSGRLEMGSTSRNHGACR